MASVNISRRFRYGGSKKNCILAWSARLLHPSSGTLRIQHPVSTLACHINSPFFQGRQDVGTCGPGWGVKAAREPIYRFIDLFSSSASKTRKKSSSATASTAVDTRKGWARGCCCRRHHYTPSKPHMLHALGTTPQKPTHPCHSASWCTLFTMPETKPNQNPTWMYLMFFRRFSFFFFLLLPFFLRSLSFFMWHS